jgi:membrane-bound serine protease (ClpP class)
MLYLPRQQISGRPYWVLLPFLLLLVALWAAPVAAQPRGPVYLLDLDGVLSRYSAGFVQRALRDAEASGAETLIVRLSVSGAVLQDTRLLADQLAAADLPVVVYVAPSGTRSGAAGAWLLNAAHIAALAPNTNFGVTTPLVVPGAELTDATAELLRAEVIAVME